MHTTHACTHIGGFNTGHSSGICVQQWRTVHRQALQIEKSTLPVAICSMARERQRPRQQTIAFMGISHNGSYWRTSCGCGWCSEVRCSRRCLGCQGKPSEKPVGQLDKACACTCVCARARVRVFACVCTCVCVCVCVCVCAYVHACTNACVHVALSMILRMLCRHSRLRISAHEEEMLKQEPFHSISAMTKLAGESNFLAIQRKCIEFVKLFDDHQRPLPNDTVGCQMAQLDLEANSCHALHGCDFNKFYGVCAHTLACLCVRACSPACTYGYAHGSTSVIWVIMVPCCHTMVPCCRPAHRRNTTEAPA